MYASQLRYCYPVLPGWEDTTDIAVFTGIWRSGFLWNQRAHLETALFPPSNPLRSAGRLSCTFIEILLALPAFLVIPGDMFLVLTNFVNKKKKCSLWKSSIMVLLFHGLYVVEHDEYQTSSKIETMAEGIDVRLEFSDHNGRLMI